MDRMDERPLPPGWQSAILGEVCLAVQKVRPQDEPDHSFTYLDIASIDNSDHRIVSPKTYSGANAPSRARQRVRGGNTLFSTVRTYLKNIAMVPPEFDGQVASTGFCVLNPSDAIDPKYVFYHTVSDDFVSKLNPLQRGTSYPAVRDDDVLAQRIDLPSLPEQRRIVAEIEKQFTRLDASVEALRRTQANLKRYRASVLRAACSGKLVPTEAELARAEGREHEPADVLLERILAERRARWESQEKRRGKYKEPAAPDTSDLPPLPEGWVLATVDQMIVRSEYGTSVKCSYESDGIPVLRIPNIVGSEIDLADLKFANQSLPVDDDRALQVGDVLMCRTNGSISLIGKTAVIKRPLEPHHSFASYLLRFRFVDCPPLSDWFHLFATSQLGRNYIEREAASSAGQHNVSLSLIHRMAVPVPPLAEQHRIVAEVERRLSVIQQAETAVEASVQRAERLRQSILKRAFAGELVPQDPDDEPASVLLERIRAQREAEQAASATKKRPARRRRATPKAQQLTLEEATA